MKRQEFMRQLEKLLQSIPEMERQEALQYYNDYFDDAGEENEKEVIEALGNPAKVAENIKRDLYGDEAGRASNVKHPPIEYKEDAEKGSASKTKEKKNFFGRMGDKFNSLPTWGQVLIIVVLILFSPVIVGIIATIVGGVFSLVTGWFSMILGFAVTALALFAVLVILFATGIMCLAEAPLGGVALMGVGLLCGGIGILFLMLVVAMVGIATPAIWKGIVKIWNDLFGKKEVTV